MFNSGEFSPNTNHELESNIAQIFGAALESTHSSLMAASKSHNFVSTIAPIFNVSGDLSRLQTLSDSWALGDFSQLPTILVLPTNSMNGANGAFSELTRTIYLSSGYLAQSFSNPDVLTGGVSSTLLEEIGHFVDTLVNPGADTAGDEGALFAVTLMGLHLSDAEKLLIHQEDDHGFVTIDGNAIAVEQALTDFPIITIAATDAIAGETATGVTANPGTFTLTRTGNLTPALTVNYTLAGTATKGVDYSNLSGTVSFAAGASTTTVKVTPTDDTLAENSETAILSLQTGTGYTLGSTTTASVTIADNETPVITIAATDAIAGETATGVTANPGTFTLTRTGNLTPALTVNYTLAGTATKGTDYSNLTGTVSFAAGASTTTVKVTPTDDTLAENSETAILSLQTGTGYTLGSTTTASITIADNETPVITIAATDAIAGETATGVTANPGTFTLTRTGNLTPALTVNYTLAGTATKGTDYSNLTGTVSFAAGANTATVKVTPTDDTLAENSETAILSLQKGTGYNLGSTTTASITIFDNETPVITIAATDAIAGETATGVTANPGTFTLTRTGNLTPALTVNYTLAGTATKGVDYSNLTGTVSFAAGANTATVKVTPTDDTLAENSETAILSLQTGTGYNLGSTTTASVTIVDNETPVISVAATDAIAGETATGVTANPGTFTLTRTGNLTPALTVNYTLAGTATKGVDYSNLTGTVSFAAGANTATVKVTPTDDTLAENSETAILSLQKGTGYNLGNTTTASVTIVDNETPVISVAATDAIAAETISGQTANPGRFTLTRTGNLTPALTVNYTLLGTAAKGTDYINLTGTVSFAAGSATAVVNITPIDDNILEASETVIFTITSGTNYKLGTAIASTITIDNIDPKGLAKFLWDTGKTAVQIGLTLKNRGFDLPTIADSVKSGITKSDGTNLNYTDVALALWNSGHSIDARKLADLLWDEGASQKQIGQAMKYLGLSLEAIADSLRQGVTKSDGTNLNYTDVAEALWNSGYGAADGLNSRKLADLLWDVGANPIAIGQAMKYLGLNLQTIADAINDGVTKKDGTHLNVIKGDGIVRNDIYVGYIYVAEALWNSGYGAADGLNSRKLADLLWDEGASQQQIGQAFNYLGLNLETIADSVKFGVTKSDGTNLNYTDVAIALWNSGYGIDSRKLADLLWDEGASQQEIGQAMKELGLSLETIADAIDDGVTNFNYTDVAIALWNSGYGGADGLNSNKLADLLWDEGASQQQIGQAMKYLGLSLETIAGAIDDGVTNSDGTSLNYTDVAIALWNSGYSGADGLNSNKLADLLWDEGASQQQIGQAMKELGFSLEIIAGAIDDGVTNSDGTSLNYTDVAIALWNSGYSGADGLNSSKLADLLWDEGASQQQIGKAMKYLGFSLETIANAIDDGVTNSDGTSLNYISVAIALWNSGYGGADGLNTRTLAKFLWNEGASQGDIGQAIKYLGYDLATIADAIKNAPGIGFNYIDVTIALWNSGYSFDTRILASVLWNEGVSQGDIGQAIRYLGYDLATIADAVTNAPGIGFNYIDVAIALWNSGLAIDTRKLAAILWNEGASQGNIGQAIKYLGYDLTIIADAIKNAPGIGFNYIDTALALWNSGYSINGGTVAAILWNKGYNQGDIGQALRVLGFSNEDIGYAVRNAPGIGFNYSDVARAVWDSGNQPSLYTIADIVKSLGGKYGDIYGALKEVGASDFNANLLALRASFQNLVNRIFDYAEEVADKTEDIVSDVKDSIADNPVTQFVLLPYTLPAAIVVNTVEAIKTGDVEVIVDGLKKVPVLGTAVGVIDGLIKAAQGDEKGVLTESINSALAFYGASNVITPNMVEFAVDIFWELKDSDYQGAISASLENLGMQKTVSDLFVAVSWSAAVDPNWENVINAALTKVGFNNASSLVNIAWDIIDQNYKEALKTGLQLAGFTNLGINQAKADAFLNLTVAIRDGNPNKAADILIALSGNNQQVIQSSWIKDLKDGNLANDRQAIQLGLSNLGFQDVTQWVNTIWAVKDGKYLDAISAVLALGKFAQGQDWVKIIDNLQKENYGEALSTAFKLAKFQDGQSLADAVLAVKKGDYVTAFYESLNLIEGGRDLADAFKYLIDFDLQEFVTSMINAAPLLLKVLV